MRRALVIATVVALAVARPETYREKEDFQYSRSSSDEGTKSGFYGAQRGNMGGNYERAHNMDTLAQHQMGGIVRTVDGDLGDGAKQKSGSVYSAANSRGVYGSNHYDLSNLQGRNFQEGASFGDSQSHSSLLSNQAAGYGSQSQSYSSAANSAYGSQSQSSRNHGYGYNLGTSDQALYENNRQSTDNLQSASQYDGAQSSYGSGYQSQSGYQGQSVYDQAAASQHLSNANGASNTRGSHYRLVGASPVRVYVRPGSTVTIPVAAQSYDASQGSSSIYDQNSQSSGLTFDQNSNSEAKVLGTGQQSAFKPTNDAKRYEASYSYRKEWEKHDTVTAVPLAPVPTVNPYPSNSEFYEDTRARTSQQREASAQEARNAHSNSQYRGYNIKSASSRNQAAYNSRAQEESSSSDAAAASSLVNSNANNYGASANLNSGNLNSQVEDFGSKPKSYQSSYSYHKSWEHQGDPYVIKPSTNGIYTAADLQASQRLTSSSSNQASGYGSQQYGSHYHQGHQSHSNGQDCDENGHIRVARSYNINQLQHSYPQTQNIQEDQEYAGQQSQNLEDFGQQPQNLENLGQQSQNLEDFGQQPQNLENLGQQSQNLEDFGQQPQNLENLGQQSQNLEDFGQQSQNLENLGQQSQNLEDFGQQSQNVHDFGRIEELGQQTQNQWDQQSQTDAGQQTQNTWTLETIPHSHDDRNTEQQQSNDKEHTIFDHQETQGSVFVLNHPSLNQPESHTTQEDISNPFAHTIFDDHRPEQEKKEPGQDIDKEFPQFDFGKRPEQHTQVYWQPFPPNMNQNNQNVYVPLSPLDIDRVRPTKYEIPDWQKILNEHNIHLNTGYGQNQHSHYQTVYGANTGFYQTPSNYNPFAQYPSYGSTAYAKPLFPSTESHNPSTHYLENVDTGFSNSWMFPPSSNPNPIFQNPENAVANTQTYVTRNNTTYAISPVNIPQESGSTSFNVWDLIDDFDKQTTSGKDTENFFHTYHTAENVQNNSNIDLTQNFNGHSFNTQDNVQNSFASLSSTTERTTITKQVNVRPHDVERGDIMPEKSKPQEEAGRGDIGPEDNVASNAPNRPLEILGISPTKPSLNKTPEELEILSLTKDNNKTTLVNSHSTDTGKQIILEQDKNFKNEFGVLSLDDQKKYTHHSEQDNWQLQSDVQKTTSTTPKTTYHYENPKINVDRESQKNTEQQQGQSVSTHQQSYNQFEHFDKQGENLRHEHNRHQQLDQQNIEQHVSTIAHGHDDIQQNTDQQFETLGQQTEDLNQQSFNQFDDLGQKTENLGQETQQFENFGQQSEGFQQESLGEFGQENAGQEHQKTDNFGQQSEGFDQESLGEFGQQSENLGQEHQKTDNFGQQSEGFQQESLGDFGQQSENLGQEHQKPDNFGQQSEGFQQENLGVFGQNSENLGQEHQKPDNFGQQSEGFQRENLGVFGQNSENLGQEHQKPDNFGQQSEGFQQENLGDFGQNSENLGQEHQKPDNFGQQSEGFQQKSLDNFGQHEQLQQESLSNFDAQSQNLNYPQKEQKLGNLGQETENLEQQSQSKDLWKPNSEASEVETLVPSSPYSKEGRTPPHSEPVVEPEFVTKKNVNVDTPPEIVTEKVGFWNKVGSKFGRAKDNVKSWFSGS